MSMTSATPIGERLNRDVNWSMNADRVSNGFREVPEGSLVSNLCSVPCGSQRVGRADDLNHLGDVVHPDNVGTEQHSGGDGRGRGPDTLGRRTIANGHSE